MNKSSTQEIQTLRVALGQLNLIVGDLIGNTDKMIKAACEARDQYSADVILFPELAICSYPPEDLLLRPGFPRHIDEQLDRLSQSVSDIDIIVGFPRRIQQNLYNAAAWLRNGKILAEYHKQELPNYSVFDEKRYFESGDKPCLVEIQGIQVALTICEDIWSKTPTAQAASAGANLIFNINASPYHMDKEQEREDIVRQRIRETGLPVVYLNLVGGQDELVFDGHSFAMDSAGNVCMRTPTHTEGIYIVDVEYQRDNAEIRKQQIVPRLQQVEAVYKTLVLGVRDYITKNGFNGAVLGLSGGIDSALTLTIAVDAIGADAVETVLLPSRYTADMSIQDAVQEAESLGVDYHIISIEPAFEALLDSLKEEFAGLPVDTTEENIQARCRGILLMAISNKKRKMVLTTGNKSEMAVGYATLYGDMAGGYAVLKDVPKKLVYELANFRNGISKVIPQRVIDRPPSAELAPDQKDTDSLPSYDVLDEILERYVEKDEDWHHIVEAGFDKATVLEVIRKVDRNEYKRRQAAPGVRITRRAFSRDRRYPITSGYSKQWS